MNNLSIVFLAELVGSTVLTLLGCGVVANVALTRTKGNNSGFLMVNFAWGFAVYAGVIVSYNSGAHLNPAVTLGLVASGATAFGAGVPVSIVSTLAYLAAQLIAALVKRTGVTGDAIDELFLGCANQAGEDNRNVARMSLLLAGLPYSVPGETVNRLCASGMSAIIHAHRAIQAGDGDIFISGGVENMTRGPWVMSKSSKPFVLLR